MNVEFFIILLILIISLILSIIISGVSYFLGDKSPDKEKVSVYECGFDPFHNPGEPFSIRFFLIGILFLVRICKNSKLFKIWPNPRKMHWKIIKFFAALGPMLGQDG